MKTWYVERYREDELQENLSAFAKQGCEIFEIFQEHFGYYLVIAYKEKK